MQTNPKTAPWQVEFRVFKESKYSLLNSLLPRVDPHMSQLETPLETSWLLLARNLTLAAGLGTGGYFMVQTSETVVVIIGAPDDAIRPRSPGSATPTTSRSTMRPEISNSCGMTMVLAKMPWS